MERKKTVDIPWDTIGLDETVTAEELAAAEDLAMLQPVGKFLVTVVKSVARENVMKAYTCIAANLELRIDDVIEIEKPIIGEDGKPITREGEPVMKHMPVEGEEKAKACLQFCGQKILTSVNLHHPLEKDGTKRRRLFVAKKLGLIVGNMAVIPVRVWGVDIVGKKAVVTTEWNRWVDDMKMPQKNVRVAWEGWEYAETANIQAVDFSGI